MKRQLPFFGRPLKLWGKITKWKHCLEDCGSISQLYHKRHPAHINQISSYSERLHLTIRLAAVLISSQSLPDFCQPFQGSRTRIRWIETTMLLHHYHPVRKIPFPPLSLIIKPALCGEKTYCMHQVCLSQGQTPLPFWHKTFVIQVNNQSPGACVHTHTHTHRWMETADVHSTGLHPSPVRRQPALVVDHADTPASHGAYCLSCANDGASGNEHVTTCTRAHMASPREGRDAGISAGKGMLPGAGFAAVGLAASRQWP